MGMKKKMLNFVIALVSTLLLAFTSIFAVLSKIIWEGLSVLIKDKGTVLEEDEE
jgi:hypothetical protein